MQTELYIPPPVENGIVPKNAYGNIDVYTPTMVPAGGSHIIRPSISIAAKFAGIDYADAVSGFDFIKRKANARLNGIVVAKENVEGLLAVWEGMMERVQEEEERRSIQSALERWRRFVIRLGIRRRLEETHGKVDDREIEAIHEMEKSEDTGGGFFPGAVRDGQGFPMGMGVEKQIDINAAVSYDAREITTDEQTSVSSHGISKSTYPNENGAQPVTKVPGNSDQTFSFSNQKVMEETDIGSGFESREVESEGGGFVQDDDDADDFIYSDEDGIL